MLRVWIVLQHANGLTNRFAREVHGAQHLPPMTGHDLGHEQTRVGNGDQ